MGILDLALPEWVVGDSNGKPEEGEGRGSGRVSERVSETYILIVNIR